MCDCLVMFAVLAASSALAADLERDLNSQYRGKVLALRYSFTGNSQDFDASGKPIDPKGFGPWTVYGRVRIKSIHLSSDNLEVKAARQLMEFKQGGLVPMNKSDARKSGVHQNVTLTLRLQTRVKDEAGAQAAWRKLFAVTPEEIVHSAPDFWRDYLADPDIAADDKTTHNPAIPTGVAQLGDKGVLAAQALQTPEPEFTELARKLQYQGSGIYGAFIDKDGEPERIIVVRPLGLGLDEVSIEAIRHWHFVPAIKDQKPVPFYMPVEISFNLN